MKIIFICPEGHSDLEPAKEVLDEAQKPQRVVLRGSQGSLGPPIRLTTTIAPPPAEAKKARICAPPEGPSLVGQLASYLMSSRKERDRERAIQERDKKDWLESFYCHACKKTYSRWSCVSFEYSWESSWAKARSTPSIVATAKRAEERLRQNPNDAIALLHSGVANGKMGHFGLAFARLGQATKLPEAEYCTLAKFALAKFKRESGNQKEAIEVLVELLREDTSDSPLWNLPPLDGSGCGPNLGSSRVHITELLGICWLELGSESQALKYLGFHFNMFKRMGKNIGIWRQVPGDSEHVWTREDEDAAYVAAGLPTELEESREYARLQGIINPESNVL